MVGHGFFSNIFNQSRTDSNKSYSDIADNDIICVTFITYQFIILKLLLHGSAWTRVCSAGSENYI